jgi:hypothetical protein
MAQKEMRSQEGIVARNISLSGEIMQFLMENPQVFSSLPDNFELVILPDDDPELRQYNLELIDKHGSGDKPIVFARVKIHQEKLKSKVQPSIFVPVQIAA